MTNLLPDFYELISDVRDASEEIDNFDVDSKNEKSLTEFNLLLAEQNRLSIGLIEFVNRNYDKLKKQFRNK